jgi:UDP-hydrolysing UDP-N-acetyl-D-glucosamine 2-epimerase
VAVITVGRSDYGIYRPILAAIQASSELQLALFVTGAHTSLEFGRTMGEIEADGFPITEVVEMLLSNDSPAAVATSMGLGTIGFASVFARHCPDVLLVLGDRFEMHAAALAAVPFKIPIAHIHGGEVTCGAIDEAFRHAITKYSHWHFASNQEHADRIVQLGEAPWRVEVTGAPGLDNLRGMRLLSRDELETRIGLSLAQAPLLVTYHPVTYQFESTAERFGELVAALEAYEGPIILTKPNADTNGRIVIQMAEQFVAKRDNAVLADSLGTKVYFSLMRQAVAMVGNSSSGIIEAASFELPVVNLGARQQGRAQSGNVINVAEERSAITRAITRAASEHFRSALAGMKNVYGDGHAADRIVSRLSTMEISESLIMKQFNDLSLARTSRGAA